MRELLKNNTGPGRIKQTEGTRRSLIVKSIPEDKVDFYAMSLYPNIPVLKYNEYHRNVFGNPV